VALQHFSGSLYPCRSLIALLGLVTRLPKLELVILSFPVMNRLLRPAGTLVLLAAGVISAPIDTPITCPGPAQEAYTTPIGDVFTIKCGIDYYGGDMGAVQAETFEKCLDACSDTSGCLAVAYAGKACYMKSELKPGIANDNVWGAVDRLALTPSTSPVYSCPNSNGLLVTEASGARFTIECSVDHYGGDMGAQQTDTFAACLSLCDSTRGCHAVAYAGKTCYMKSDIKEGVANDHVWGAVDYVALAPTTPTYTCPGSGGLEVTEASGKKFTIECAIDRYGGDMGAQVTDSFAACISLCDTTHGCLAVAYAGAMCYMKNTVMPPHSNPGVLGAVASTLAQAPTSPAVTCPADDGDVITEGDKHYLVRCSTDNYGGDMGNQVTQTFRDCLALCASTKGCVVVSFPGPGPATCWMKSTITDNINHNPDIWGAIETTVAPPSTTTSTSSASITSTSTTSTSTTLTSTTSTSITSTSITSTSTMSTSTTSATTTSTTSPPTPTDALNLVWFVYADTDQSSTAKSSLVNGQYIQISSNNLVPPFANPWPASNRLYGQPKSICMIYEYGNSLRVFLSRESMGQFTIRPGPVNDSPNSYLVAPIMAKPASAGFEILGVYWGTARIVSTSVWNSLYTGPQVNWSNEYFGTDPWSGHPKVLVIVYRDVNGFLQRFIALEGTTSYFPPRF
jgi:hypothetical protein